MGQTPPTKKGLPSAELEHLLVDGLRGLDVVHAQLLALGEVQPWAGDRLEGQDALAAAGRAVLQKGEFGVSVIDVF